MLSKNASTLPPLPPLRAGADGAWKEFRLVQYYSEDQTRRWISVSRGDHEAVGRLMKRDASRIRLCQADASIGLYDGAVWIDRQAQQQGLRLTGRLKGQGRRWNPDNALAVMALEALQQSHEWPSYWNLN